MLILLEENFNAALHLDTYWLVSFKLVITIVDLHSRSQLYKKATFFGCSFSHRYLI